MAVILLTFGTYRASQTRPGPIPPLRPNRMMAGLLAAVVLGLIEVGLVLPEPVPVALPGRCPGSFPRTEPAGLGSLPGTVNLVPAVAHAAELLVLELACDNTH